MKLRDLAKKFLQFKVGDGENIFLWLDCWHLNGVLLEKYGFRIFYDSGSRLRAKLSSVIKNRNRCWPPARSEDLVCILSVLPEMDIGESDMPIWNISKKGIYSCSKTWEAIRCRLPKVNCCCLVWFPMAIPWHAFILWLAVKDSLSTGEKLASWGLLRSCSLLVL